MINGDKLKKIKGKKKCNGIAKPGNNSGNSTPSMNFNMGRRMLANESKANFKLKNNVPYFGNNLSKTNNAPPAINPSEK